MKSLYKQAGAWRRAAIVVAVTAGLGCGSGAPQGEPAIECVAGATQACTGLAGCVGTRTCDAAARAWSACVCPSPADGAAPDGGGGPVLGGACDGDDDCPAGAFCLGPMSSGFFGGAPPVGVCVARCDARGSCVGFGAATCVDVGGGAVDGGASVDAGALCFESCHIGGPASAAGKCHGRAQVACTPLSGAATEGYCRPICVSSAECLTGVCDPARGVCADMEPVDQSFGQFCAAPVDGGAPGDAGADARSDAVGGNDAGASSSDGAADAVTPPARVPPSVCGGLCTDIGAAEDVCSRRCRFGSTSECAPRTGDARRGGCLLVTPGGGIGDLGFCAELCDCSGDCAEPSFVCDAFDDAALERAFGRKGVCTAPALVLNRALACPR